MSSNIKPAAAKNFCEAMEAREYFKNGASLKSLTIHIGEEIRQWLLTQERSVTWLAKKIDCDRSNLHKNLKCPHIHPELLYRISVALGVDFFARYSQQLQEDIQGQGQITATQGAISHNTW